MKQRRRRSYFFITFHSEQFCAREINYEPNWTWLGKKVITVFSWIKANLNSLQLICLRGKNCLPLTFVLVLLLFTETLLYPFFNFLRDDTDKTAQEVRIMRKTLEIIANTLISLIFWINKKNISKTQTKTLFVPMLY